MSDQDLLDIIESLKTLQIQQQQIIQRQRDLMEQLDHILAGCGGGMIMPGLYHLIPPLQLTPIEVTPHHLSHPAEFH